MSEKSKKIYLIAMLIFWAGVIVVLGAGVQEGNVKGERPLSEISENNLLSEQQGVETLPFLSGEMVKVHQFVNDCWIIVENRVYDVTPYLALHPGGAESITLYCGGDATEAFQTKGKNPPSAHSQFARGLLDSYYVGTLGKEVSSARHTAPFPAKESMSSQSLPETQKNNEEQKISSEATTGENVGSNDQNVDPAQNLLLTLDKVARHASGDDCWIVVDGGVYEVTGYLASHPGGAGIILSYCGKDASAAFHSKGKRKPKDHSPKAYQQLSRYYIGPLGGKKLIGK